MLLCMCLALTHRTLLLSTGQYGSQKAELRLGLSWFTLALMMFMIIKDKSDHASIQFLRQLRMEKVLGSIFFSVERGLRIVVDRLRIQSHHVVACIVWDVIPNELSKALLWYDTHLYPHSKWLSDCPPWQKPPEISLFQTNVHPLQDLSVK